MKVSKILIVDKNDEIFTAFNQLFSNDSSFDLTFSNLVPIASLSNYDLIIADEIFAKYIHTSKTPVVILTQSLNSTRDKNFFYLKKPITAKDLKDFIYTIRDNMENCLEALEKKVLNKMLLQPYSQESKKNDFTTKIKARLRPNNHEIYKIEDLIKHCVFEKIISTQVAKEAQSILLEILTNLLTFNSCLIITLGKTEKGVTLEVSDADKILDPEQNSFFAQEYTDIMEVYERKNERSFKFQWLETEVNKEEAKPEIRVVNF